MTNQEAQLLSRRAFMRKGVCATLGATGMLSTIANLRMEDHTSTINDSDTLRQA
jgi:hypothetical protein